MMVEILRGVTEGAGDLGGNMGCILLGRMREEGDKAQDLKGLN